MSDLIEDISKNLGRIMRYIFPGLFILGASSLAYPSWFKMLDVSKNFYFLFLLTAAIVIGNTWYAFHRYGIHQFIDYIMFAIGLEGPVGKKGHRGFSSYISVLSEHVVLSFVTGTKQPIREHVILRASQMHLMYITSESLLLFSWFNECGSFFAQNQLEIRIVAIVLSLFTVIQNIITRRIDWLSIQNKSI
jgi:hypothetical protein